MYGEYTSVGKSALNVLCLSAMYTTTTFGGVMALNRLRQMDNTGNLVISGGKRQYVLGYPAASWTTSFKGIGKSQHVYDEYYPSPFKAKTRIGRNRMRLLLEVPPLRPVKMSKTVYNTSPRESELNHYYCKDPSFEYILSGGNLGYAPFSNGMMNSTNPSWPGSLISTDPKVDSYLLQRALSKASSAEYDFGITIGEIAETASFLAKPLAGIVKLSAAAFAGCRAIYKHGTLTCVQLAKNATAKQTRRIVQTSRQHPIDSSLRILDETANHWLAYKFAVLPIIDDIGKVTDFREKNLAQKLGLRVARVKGKATDTTVAATGYDLQHSEFIYGVFATKRTIDQHSTGLYVKNAVQAPLLNFMEGLGFAPWQLFSLAYELIPLSFVVDRFIDIKSFVRGNIGSLTKDCFGSYHTRKITTVCATHVVNVRIGAYRRSVSVTGPALQASVTMTQMARSINADRPRFPVVNPYWRNQLIADATNMSLIWGRLRSHVGKFL